MNTPKKIEKGFEIEFPKNKKKKCTKSIILKLKLCIFNCDREIKYDTNIMVNGVIDI
jgi:hypothetical protein